jgi:hypothetical protein
LARVEVIALVYLVIKEWVHLGVVAVVPTYLVRVLVDWGNSPIFPLAVLDMLAVS